MVNRLNGSFLLEKRAIYPICTVFVTVAWLVPMYAPMYTEGFWLKLKWILEGGCKALPFNRPYPPRPIYLSHYSTAVKRIHVFSRFSPAPHSPIALSPSSRPFKLPSDPPSSVQQTNNDDRHSNLAQTTCRQ